MQHPLFVFVHLYLYWNIWLLLQASPALDGSHSETWRQRLVLSNYLAPPQIETKRIKLTLGKSGNDSLCQSIVVQFHQKYLAYIRETLSREAPQQKTAGFVVYSLLVQDFWSSGGNPIIVPPRAKDSFLYFPPWSLCLFQTPHSTMWLQRMSQTILCIQTLCPIPTELSTPWLWCTVSTYSQSSSTIASSHGIDPCCYPTALFAGWQWSIHRCGFLSVDDKSHDFREGCHACFITVEFTFDEGKPLGLGPTATSRWLDYHHNIHASLHFASFWHFLLPVVLPLTLAYAVWRHRSETSTLPFPSSTWKPSSAYLHQAYKPPSILHKAIIWFLPSFSSKQMELTRKKNGNLSDL